ncbi:TetR/AcrR family transcriptional regulator [Nocardia sp. NBC_00881]|uniref:TetR/AcrR family transcriptional regulator n=1 Tax=Nocardia sp. NBC_00881 TaxID=2975995 RepID=UPI00386C876E|nr:TetR/AcrR family transcriptional regulator [Nocardia sp. NBC_00881]
MVKAVDRVQRREDILGAAVRVFACKGFAASRVEDVAAEAGIAKGSVYLYFDSRDALLAGVFESYRARSDAVLATVGEGPALERLARLVGGVVDMLAAHRDHARVLLDVWASAPSLDMAAVYRQYREAISELLRQAWAEGELRPDVSEHHATLIVAAIEGCLLQWLADDRMPLTELATPIIELTVEGIRA